MIADRSTMVLLLSIRSPAEPTVGARSAPWLTGVLLLVAALGLATGLTELSARRGPVGDEADHLMIAASLALDHDLTFDRPDLDRARRMWSDGPVEARLFTSTGGTRHFAGASAWGLIAAPFYRFAGPTGLLLVNLLLLAALVAAVRRRGAAAVEEEPPASGLRSALLAALLVSAAPLAALSFGPTALRMAALFLVVELWLSGRLDRGGRRALWLAAAAGALLAISGRHEPLDLLFAVPLLVDLGRRRLARPALALAVGLLAASLALAAADRRLTGRWWPSAGAETAAAGEAGAAIDDGRSATPRNLVYRLVGRHVGILPLFPALLWAVGSLVRGGRDRRRLLLAASLAVWLAGFWWLRPLDAAAAAGGAFAGVFPLALLLPRRPPGRVAAAALAAIAGLWTLPLVSADLAAAPMRSVSSASEGALGLRPVRALPLELTAFDRGATADSARGTGVPGYRARVWEDQVWLLPEAAFFVDEPHPNGIWVRGGVTADALLVRAAGRTGAAAANRGVDEAASSAAEPAIGNGTGEIRLDLVLRSLAGSRARLDGGAGAVRVVFDSPAKREGTPVRVTLAPIARDLGRFFPRETWYRLRVEASDGVVPAEIDPGSADRRLLGLFLDFTGGGM